MITLVAVYISSGQKKYIEVEKLDIVFYIAAAALLGIYAAFSIIALLRQWTKSEIVTKSSFTVLT